MVPQTRSVPPPIRGRLGGGIRQDPYFSGPFDVRYLPDVGHFAPLEAPELVSGPLVEHFTVPRPRLVRERPYISLAGIVPGTPALDRYSFPSGHTLHAVSFTILAISSFPELAWLLVPFATLVAASRVVLGLHYPTDVAAGAIIGATLATVSMVVVPVVCAGAR